MASVEGMGTAMDALLATKGMELIHDVGTSENPNTSLPAKVFCDILTRIREEILSPQN